MIECEVSGENHCPDTEGSKMGALESLQGYYGEREPHSLWPLRAEQGPAEGKSQGQISIRNSEELSNRQRAAQR